MDSTRHEHANLDYWTKPLGDGCYAVFVKGHNIVATITGFDVAGRKRYRWSLEQWPQRRAVDPFLKDAAYWAVWAWYTRTFLYDPAALKAAPMNSLTARARAA